MLKFTDKKWWVEGTIFFCDGGAAEKLITRSHCCDFVLNLSLSVVDVAVTPLDPEVKGRIWTLGDNRGIIQDVVQDHLEQMSFFLVRVDEFFVFVAGSRSLVQSRCFFLDSQEYILLLQREVFEGYFLDIEHLLFALGYNTYQKIQK
jgi:hypothetical protein